MTVRQKYVAKSEHVITIAYMDAATIEQQALELTVAERAVLADHLLQTLNVEDPERLERWGQEADRRLQAFERGEMLDLDGPAAVVAIRRRLG